MNAILSMILVSAACAAAVVLASPAAARCVARWLWARAYAQEQGDQARQAMMARLTEEGW